MNLQILSDIFKTLIVIEKSNQKKTIKKQFLLLDLNFYDHSNMKFCEKKMLEKIIKLQKKDFAIIFIDFQKLQKGELINLEKTKKKYNSLLTILNGETGILIATKKDEFQLPSVGIMDYIYEQKFLGIDKDSKVYYCSVLKKSKSNKKIPISQLFCQNANINFISLKSFIVSDNFISQNSKKKFPFKELILENDSIYKPIKTLIEKNIKEKVCFILIGSPASGKSYFSTQCLPKNFVRLNNDTIKNLSKMNKLYIENLEQGNNIVFDNTNPMAEKRKFYIEKAKKKGYKIFCLFFNLPKEFVFHLNQLRKFSFFKNNISQSAPPIAIYSYFKKLNKPNQTEGFDNIITITKFFPNFKTEQQKKYFNYIYN